MNAERERDELRNELERRTMKTRERRILELEEQLAAQQAVIDDTTKLLKEIAETNNPSLGRAYARTWLEARAAASTGRGQK